MNRLLILRPWLFLMGLLPFCRRLNRPLTSCRTLSTRAMIIYRAVGLWQTTS